MNEEQMASMSFRDYMAEHKVLDKQDDAARRALKIRCWGPCQREDGHFDIRSFVVGILAGATLGAGIAFITHVLHRWGANEIVFLSQRRSICRFFRYVSARLALLQETRFQRSQSARLALVRFLALNRSK
jgi:hypothetical protein